MADKKITYQAEEFTQLKFPFAEDYYEDDCEDVDICPSCGYYYDTPNHELGCTTSIENYEQVG